jgi:glycosyltransferase involved in cell wall biosynthesis
MTSLKSSAVLLPGPGSVWTGVLRNHKRPLVKSSVFRVLHAGGLNDTNGIPDLLLAFQTLDPKKYELILTGAGPHRDLVENASRRNSNITFCGLLSRDDLEDLYSDVDAAISYRPSHPASMLSFPSKVLEYMAHGIPVLSNPTAHVMDEYGEYLTPIVAESPEGIARAVREAEADGFGIQERALRGWDYLAQEKTWAVQARRLMDFLVSLVDSDPLHPAHSE